MKKRQLLYPVILLLLAACQKGVMPGVVSQSAGSKAAVLPGAFTSDTYKIGSIAIQGETDSLTLSDADQINYKYNTDGTLQNITSVSIEKYKKTVASDSIFSTTITTTLNYSYRGDTVVIDRVVVNSLNSTVHTHGVFHYVKDSMGRWAQLIQDYYGLLTGAPTGTAITQFAYNSNNQLISQTYLPSYFGATASVNDYSWLNGNVYSSYPVNPVNGVPYDVDRYTYYTDQSCQPGDISVLKAQLANGLALPVSANLTMSDIGYDGRTNQNDGGFQYTYEFDSKGRASKGTEALSSSTAPQDFQVLRTYTIHYLNN